VILAIQKGMLVGRRLQHVGGLTSQRWQQDPQLKYLCSSQRDSNHIKQRSSHLQSYHRTLIPFFQLVDSTPVYHAVKVVVFGGYSGIDCPAICPILQCIASQRVPRQECNNSSTIKDAHYHGWYTSLQVIAYSPSK
jgi:hypothetical protein